MDTISTFYRMEFNSKPSVLAWIVDIQISKLRRLYAVGTNCRQRIVDYEVI